MTDNNYEPLEKALQESGLSFRVGHDRKFWFATVTNVLVVVMPDRTQEYVSIGAPIPLHVTVDELDREKLLRLLQVSSSTPLAKVELLEVDGKVWLAATSECAYQAITGLKLRRRIEACAQLAARLSAEVIAPKKASGEEGAQ